MNVSKMTNSLITSDKDVKNLTESFGKWYTIQELAELCGFDVDYLRNNIKSMLFGFNFNVETKKEGKSHQIFYSENVLKALKEYQIKNGVSNATKDKENEIKHRMLPTTSVAGSVTDEKLMTTRELAETLGVDVKTVQRIAEGLYDIDVVKSISTGGRPTKAFSLEQATAIKIELQNHSKLARNGFTTMTISNDLEAWELQKRLDAYKDRRIAELQAENEIQKRQLSEQKPKVEYVDAYCDSENLEEIGHLGKVTKIGEIKIFRTLLKDGVIKERHSTDGVKCYDPCFGYEKYFETLHVPFLRGEKQLSRDKLMLNHKGFMYFRAKYATEETIAETADKWLEKKLPLGK